DAMVESKPRHVIALARLHGVHEPLAAMAGLRGSHRNPGRVERIAKCVDRSRQADRALARQRHPQGCASPSGHSVLSTTLTRPPSVRTASWVRKLAIGVGRRNHAVAETAVPHFRSSARASTSAASRLATAPPCSPANGPAARAEGCQQFGAASGSKIAKAISSGEKYWVLVQNE